MKWYSIREKLPPDGETVLMRYRRPSGKSAFFLGSYFENHKEWFDVARLMVTSKPTHWAKINLKEKWRT